MNRGSMSIRRMESILKSRPDFVDYVSQEHRKCAIVEYERRIEALQHAKATLEGTPVYRLHRKNYKNAEQLCKQIGWKDEDAARIIEEFLQKRPARNKDKLETSRIVTSLGHIGHAMMLA